MFLKDKGADFKKRFRGFDFTKVNEYQIESGKRTAMLKGVLSESISNSELNSIFECVNHFVNAAKSRQTYKQCKTEIATNTKLLADSKVQSELVSKKVEILKGSVKDCERVTKVYNELRDKLSTPMVGSDDKDAPLNIPTYS